MDVEDYRAARRTRLVGLARDLGVPADEAGALVDRVIEAQRRRVQRAEDPDDVVVPALREEVLGRPRSRLVPAAILVLAAVVVGAFAVALVPRPHDDPDGPDRPDDPPARTTTVPSLLGLTADEAAAALAGDRLALRTRTVPQCNPAGQVLGSVPPAGASVTEGDVVTLIATAAPDWACPDDEDARDTAWAFLRYLVSGSARPDFADEVGVYVDGRPVAVVSGAEPTTSPVWESAVRDPVVAYVVVPAPNDLGQPVVSVTTRRGPAATTCGRGVVPPRLGGTSTRLVLTSGRRADVGGCGLTIDLVEDARGDVAAVALSRP